MPKHLQVRSLTEEEQRAVRRLATSRTAAARVVQRAKVIMFMLDDATLAAGVAAQIAGYQSAAAGWRIVKRFNTIGVASFDDAPRAGRPRTHAESVRSALISLAVQQPASLGLPFALWTLERLPTAFYERHGVHLSDATIWTWLAEEGLHWNRQQSWFHDALRHDPEFVEKRGPYFRRMSRHHQARASFALTSWGRWRSRRIPAPSGRPDLSEPPLNRIMDAVATCGYMGHSSQPRARQQ